MSMRTTHDSHHQHHDPCACASWRHTDTRLHFVRSPNFNLAVTRSTWRVWSNGVDAHPHPYLVLTESESRALETERLFSWARVALSGGEELQRANGPATSPCGRARPV